VLKVIGVESDKGEILRVDTGGINLCAVLYIG